MPQQYLKWNNFTITKKEIQKKLKEIQNFIVESNFGCQFEIKTKKG